MEKGPQYEVECYTYFLRYEKLKRYITLLQASINREEPIDEEAILQQVDLECADYQKKLQEMENDLDVAKHFLSSPMLSEEESNELKAIYKRLAKKLHPDMKKEEEDTKQGLWSLVQDAYKRGDIELMRSLEYAAEVDYDEKEDMDRNVMSVLRENILWVKDRILRYMKQIGEIRNSFPFTYADFLNNDTEIERKKKEYVEQIQRYRDLILELEEYKRALVKG